MDWMSGRLEEIPVELELEIKELENILLNYNSFDMIGNFIVSEVFQDVNNLSTGQKKYFIVEYLSLLYLKHPFCQGAGELIDGNVVEDIKHRIHSIFAKSNFLLTGLAESERDTGIGDLRFNQVLEELFVRGPAYPHHAKEIYLKFLKVGESVHYLISTPKYPKNSLSLATDSVDHR